MHEQNWPQEHERALKGTYKGYLIPGIPRTGINSSVCQVKPHIKVFIKDQLKEMQSTKVIMTLWVRWKKTITLGSEDVGDAQDVEGNTGDDYIRVEMPFNSLRKVFFEGSGMEEVVVQHMIAHIKTQVESPQVPKVVLHWIKSCTYI